MKQIFQTWFLYYAEENFLVLLFLEGWIHLNWETGSDMLTEFDTKIHNMKSQKWIFLQLDDTIVTFNYSCCSFLTVNLICTVIPIEWATTSLALPFHSWDVQIQYLFFFHLYIQLTKPSGSLNIFIKILIAWFLYSGFIQHFLLF